jgi:hypothetical protein
MQRKSSRKTRSQKEVGAVLEFVFAKENTKVVSDSDELITVPSKLHYHGYDYALVCRGVKYSLYEQLFEEKIVGYEVTLIKIQKETVLYGKIIKKHERWAKDGDFGKTAFSYFTIKDAMKKYNKLESLPQSE